MGKYDPPTDRNYRAQLAAGRPLADIRAEVHARVESEDAWYGAIADALRIIGKRWYSDVTGEEDAFVLAYADKVATRPEHERDEKWMLEHGTGELADFDPGTGRSGWDDWNND
jgi:hypothetical protein